ncbi:MAG: riboflavin biosynthesis protein RibF, partial [Chloroflexi bacterium RBG_16_57_9]
MRTVTNLDELQPTVPTTLTIGKFDGVHLGHQQLIRHLNERARDFGGQSAALILYPHPQEVLAPQRPVEYLTSLEERLNLMAGLGLDLAIVLEFTHEVAGTPARHFVEKILRHVKLAELWVGPNFALGRGREGNVPYLRTLAEELGFDVRIATMLDVDGQTISSSHIREMLRSGQVETAGKWLGRPPGLRGLVTLGARRGHSLGFPTANLDVLPKLMIPANGVYAVRVGLGAEVLPGVANVGVRPSFDNGQRTVEVYIFDFNRDIYGQEIEVQ